MAAAERGENTTFPHVLIPNEWEGNSHNLWTRSPGNFSRGLCSTNPNTPCCRDHAARLPSAETTVHFPRNPHQSGTSIRGDRVTRFGNHRLKNAFYLAAFSSLKHPPSRTYYDRKRSEGKRHTQAVLCLARRRVDVLHAMLTTNTLYQAPPLRTDLETAA